MLAAKLYQKQTTSCLALRETLVCCMAAGKQYAITDRSLKGIECYTGLSMFAGKQGDAVNYLQNGRAEDKVHSSLQKTSNFLCRERQLSTEVKAGNVT